MTATLENLSHDKSGLGRSRRTLVPLSETIKIAKAEALASASRAVGPLHCPIRRNDSNLIKYKNGANLIALWIKGYLNGANLIALWIKGYLKNDGAN